MKIRQALTTPRAFRGAAFGSLAVLAALATSGSCREQGQEEEATVTARDPLAVVKAAEARLLFQEALRSPPEVTDRGFVVRSIRSPEEERQRGSRWTAHQGGVSVEARRDGSGFVVTSPRLRAALNARPVEDGPSSSSVEGAAVVTRGVAGSVRSALLARPNAVEDLLYKTDARQVTGYELDLPEGWSLRQPPGFPGLVEIRDRSNKPRMRILARVAWDATGRRFPVTARVDARQITFSVSEEAELPVVIDPEWQDTGTPAIVRARATSTLMQDGRVIVIGGVAGADDATAGGGEVLCTTEIYSPFDLTWEAGPAVQAPEDSGCTPIMEHVAVPLPDGTVLVTGGANRAQLVGAGQPAALATAWRFDPREGAFSRIGTMNEARVHHTATLIPSPDPVGNPDAWQVLIAGGQDRMTPFSESNFGCKVGECQRCLGTSTAELFDSSGNFTKLEMDLPRACHTATLLEDGLVMFIGGGSNVLSSYSGVHGTPEARLSVFRPGVGFETLPTQLNAARFGHVAVHRPDTNQILVALGQNEVCLMGDTQSCGTLPSVEAEVIDVDGALSGTTPAAVTCTDGCPTPRSYAAAILNRDGTVLIAGGQEADLSHTLSSDDADVFSFGDGGNGPQFIGGAPKLLSPASKPVLTNLPTGNTLLVGLTAPAELFPDDDWGYEDDVVQPTMSQPRMWETTTLLPDGTVLIAGGFPGSTDTLPTTEIFNPFTLTLAAGPTMNTQRGAHTATFLPAANGKPARVLVTGGLPSPADAGVVATSTAEVLEVGGAFVPTTAPMHAARAYHAAVRLPSGRVLVVGDYDGTSVTTPSADLFDPDTDEFVQLPAPLQARLLPIVALLPNGKVLVAGGYTGVAADGALLGELSSAEIFDPTVGENGEFRPTGNMIVPRGAGTATVLASGNVLIVGGSGASATAELFDPDTETFALADGTMNHLRLTHTATMLPSGKVLVSGGVEAIGAFPHADSEIFDPSTEQFELVPADADTPGRSNHPALLLPTGEVALFGGTSDDVNTVADARISLVAPEGTPVALDPALLSAPADAVPGDSYPIVGTDLTRYWASSSGPYASHAGAPIAIWVPLNGAPVSGTFAPFTEAGATWTPPSSPYQGQGVLFTSIRGQHGNPGVPVALAKAPNGIACTSDTACDSGFCSDGVCCDDRCHVAGEEGRACRACSVAMGAEVDGVCSFVDQGTDPHDECPKAPECAERFAVCGGDGACMPCRCESNLDCASGYVCTADGNCEEPPTIASGGCSTSSAPTDSPSGWTWMGLAALLLRNRRAKPVVSR